MVQSVVEVGPGDAIQLPFLYNMFKKTITFPPHHIWSSNMMFLASFYLNNTKAVFLFNH